MIIASHPDTVPLILSKIIERQSGVIFVVYAVVELTPVGYICQLNLVSVQGIPCQSTYCVQRCILSNAPEI